MAARVCLTATCRYRSCATDLMFDGSVLCRDLTVLIIVASLHQLVGCSFALLKTGLL